MVFIPKDAAAGSAKLCLSLEENTKSTIAKIVPLELDISITKEAPQAAEWEIEQWKRMGWDPNASPEENDKKIEEYEERWRNKAEAAQKERAAKKKKTTK